MIKFGTSELASIVPNSNDYLAYLILTDLKLCKGAYFNTEMLKNRSENGIAVAVDNEEKAEGSVPMHDNTSLQRIIF